MKPKWATRIDRGALLSSHVRPDGSMLLQGYAAREGILEYVNVDGSVTRELVRADTLIAASGTLGRSPVTLDHPDEAVTPENAKRLVVGDVDGSVAMAGGFVRVQLAVRDAAAIRAVKGGKVELSCGYDAQIDSTPGADPAFGYPGNEEGSWDAEQTARVNNHLAIVDMARAGPDCAVRVDGVSKTVIRADTGAVEHPMKFPRLLALLPLLGVTGRYDSDDAAIDAAIDAAKRRKDEEAEAQAAADATAEEVSAELEAAKAKVAELEAALAAMTAAKDADAEKADRADMAELAKTLGVTVTDGAKARDIRKAIAAHRLGELKADAADAFVDAVVEVARTDTARGTGRQAGIAAWTAGQNDGANRTDSAPTRRLTANEQRLAHIAAARKART